MAFSPAVIVFLFLSHFSTVSNLLSYQMHLYQILPTKFHVSASTAHFCKLSQCLYQPFYYKFVFYEFKLIHKNWLKLGKQLRSTFCFYLPSRKSIWLFLDSCISGSNKHILANTRHLFKLIHIKNRGFLMQCFHDWLSSLLQVLQPPPWVAASSPGIWPIWHLQPKLGTMRHIANVSCCLRAVSILEAANWIDTSENIIG